MEIVRWLLAVPLLAISVLIAFGQIFAMAAATRRLKADPDAGGYSCVPLVGGLIGTVSALIAPHTLIQRLWWVPLIVDPGYALMFSAGAVFLVGQFIRRFTGPPTIWDLESAIARLRILVQGSRCAAGGSTLGAGRPSMPNTLLHPQLENIAGSLSWISQR